MRIQKHFLCIIWELPHLFAEILHCFKSIIFIIIFILGQQSNLSPLLDCNLAVVKRPCVLQWLQEGFIALEGSTKPERLRGRRQTNQVPSPPGWRLGVGLTTPPVEEWLPNHKPGWGTCPSDGDNDTFQPNPQGSWEAGIPSDAKEIYSCGDMEHPNHAPGWRGCHFGQRNGVLQPLSPG